MLRAASRPRASASVIILSVFSLDCISGAGATGVADYICQGLGIAAKQPVAYEDVVSEEVTVTAPYAIVETVVTVTASQPTTTQTVDLAAAAVCSKSWDDYYKYVYSPNVVNVEVTSTLATVVTQNITYGTGDVYTTRDGIPVASGNFTPTRTALRVFNVTSTTELFSETTYNPGLVRATPNCTTLGPKLCSSLYVDYISSLSLPFNASVPSITPAPSNSPPCPTYYYKPYTTCFSSFQTSYANDCTIFGNEVQLFYFPSDTASPGTNTSGPMTTPPPLVYSYAPGTTFTSPSVYLKFDYLSAERLINNNYNNYCISCGPKGCVTSGVDGGQARNSEGTRVDGQLITLRPEELSSVVLNYNNQQASSIIRTLAKGLPGYINALESIVGNFNVSYEPLDLAAYTNPSPQAYYLRPNIDIPGCNFSVPDQQCSTIFEGEYRALVSLPAEVTGLQGPWKSCLPVVYGVYDPPQVLTEASRADAPTLPGGKTIPQYEPTTQQPAATLPRPPPATLAPTAAPDLLPSNNGRPNQGGSGPTLPANRPGGNTPAQSANLPDDNRPAQTGGGNAPVQTPGSGDRPAQNPQGDRPAATNGGGGGGSSGNGGNNNEGGNRFQSALSIINSAIMIQGNGGSGGDGNENVRIPTTVTESIPENFRTYETTVSGSASVATERIPGSVRTYETTVPGVVETATGTISGRLSTYKTTRPASSDRPDSTATESAEASGTGLANASSKTFSSQAYVLLAGSSCLMLFTFVG